jgi:uncharacterized Rmd1/YagE family protein
MLTNMEPITNGHTCMAVVSVASASPDRTPNKSVMLCFPECLQAYPDVLYGRYSRLGELPIGDIFYFDYGCVAFWGLTQKQEQVSFC